MFKNMISIISFRKRPVAYLITGMLLMLSLVSCEKLIEVQVPQNMLPSDVVFQANSTASAAVNGMYITMAGKSGFNYLLTVTTGMAADEFYYTNTNVLYDQFAANTIAPLNNANNVTLWSDPYAVIYQANLIIEGLTAESAVADSLKKQYIGEAKFMRAFCHFYLTNLYGKVPVITSSDLSQTQFKPRSEVADVYRQIIADLVDAEQLMTDDYKYSPTAGDRTRANKYAAAALLARVYLYNEQWDLAQQEASKVIAKSSLYSLSTNLATNSPFFKNSTEAILQWYSHLSVTSGYANEGSVLKPTSTSATAVIAVRDTLLKLFETGDARKTNWLTTFKPYQSTITYTIANKYRFNSTASSTAAGKLEGYTLLRVGEMYLIKAEALARIGTDLDGVKTALNAIRNTRGLGNTTATDQAGLLTAIAKERQIELFAEMGHRWFDLKRTGKADALMTVLKPATWKSTAVLFPVPQEVSNTNPGLLPQNGGY
jgi:hypothetical protein